MDSQRILAVGGLILSLAGAAFGLLYDAFLLREQQYSLTYHLAMAVNMAAKGDLAMAGAFVEKYGAESWRSSVLGRIPFQLLLTGAIAAIPLWLMSKLDISERMKRMLALLLLSGGAIAALGNCLQATERFAAGLWLVLGGYSWMAVSLLGYLIYGILFVRLHYEKSAKQG